MDMDQIISGIVGIIVIGIIILKFLSSKKVAGVDNYLGYLEDIKDALETIIKEASDVISITESSYETEEAYRQALLTQAIARLKTIGADLNIDMSLIDKIPDYVIAQVLDSLIDKFIKDEDLSKVIKKEEDKVIEQPKTEDLTLDEKLNTDPVAIDKDIKEALELWSEDNVPDDNII